MPFFQFLSRATFALSLVAAVLLVGTSYAGAQSWKCLWRLNKKNVLDEDLNKRLCGYSLHELKRHCDHRQNASKYKICQHRQVTGTSRSATGNPPKAVQKNDPYNDRPPDSQRKTKSRRMNLGGPVEKSQRRSLTQAVPITDLPRPKGFARAQVGQCNNQIPNVGERNEHFHMSKERFEKLKKVVSETYHAPANGDRGKRLTDLTPKNIDLACPGYSSTHKYDPIRANCWAHLLVSMSFMESRWNTQKVFVETSGDRSRGFFMLATNAKSGYSRDHCDLNSSDFKRGGTNGFLNQARCAAAVMIQLTMPKSERYRVKRWAAQPDGYLFAPGRRNGASRRWSVLRGTSKKNRHCQYNIASTTAQRFLKDLNQTRTRLTQMARSYGPNPALPQRQNDSRPFLINYLLR